MITSPVAAGAVRVEVVFLRADGDQATLQYRFTHAAMSGEQHPDDVAAALVRAGGRGTQVDVLHSTSWRYESGAGVVLTYAALPDPDRDAPATALLAPSVVASGDPLRPSPDLVHAHHVAAHAVRHLAELAQRDPAVVAAAARPEHHGLWRAIATAAATTPTGTHAEVHAAASTVRPHPRTWASVAS